ncbi:tetratricopeptide repeat protein [Roseitranquillus sediminis]|uniref:tetratricopeptide repeat protein n=1 Tax=Roseitranquillus sediminis TaxID=2809051 RepID=UPI001D0BFEA5|nr:tetratricopeptide repeat protein [Roseitranquillus sediminis]MBM9594550.1 tetratricopeptide repeat protein [Roseitranquillus sediminis]
MGALKQIHKLVVAASVCAGLAAGPAASQQRDLDELFAALKTAEGDAVVAIEQKIYEEWSQSGSPAMDLLLDRGREAMEAQEWDVAIGHFSALIDHAPDFAEGYNARATAYFQAERFGEALEDIRRTLALNPQHFGAMSGLAIILERIGEDDAALEAWREVAKITPNHPELDEVMERLERRTMGETL